MYSPTLWGASSTRLVILGLSAVPKLGGAGGSLLAEKTGARSATWARTVEYEGSSPDSVRARIVLEGSEEASEDEPGEGRLRMK